MGLSSTLDSPASETPGSQQQPGSPVPGGLRSGGDVDDLARAYALDILLLAPEPITEEIITAAVHRAAGRRNRSVDPAKVHAAVREEAYRVQQQADRVRKRATRTNRRVDDARRPKKLRRILVVLELLVLVALVVAAVVFGIRALNDENTPSETGPAVVRGRVTGDDGDAAAGASITVTDPEGLRVTEAVTDGDGTFVIGDLSEGGYVLIVTDDRSQLESSTADVFVEPGDDVDLSIVLDAR